MAGPSSDMDIAQKTWEIENDINGVPASDAIFRYDAQEQQQFLAARKRLNHILTSFFLATLQIFYLMCVCV